MTKSFFSFIKDFYKQNKKSAILLTAGSLFWAFTFPVGPLLLGYIIDQLKVMEHAGSRGYAPVVLTGLAFVAIQFLRNWIY